MTAAHVTRLASLICADANIQVSYVPYNPHGFVWEFHRGAKFLKRIRRLSAVIEVAQKLVDKGK